MNVSQIREIAKAMSDFDLAEVQFDEGDTRLLMRSRGAVVEAVKTAVQPPVPAAAKEAPVADSASVLKVPNAGGVLPQDSQQTEGALAGAGSEELVVVASPMVGVFYVAPAPGETPFASVGDEVAEGQVLCIVEAMKMMNEVESTVSGIVQEVLVGDGEPVEYDQPLFLVKPSA